MQIFQAGESVAILVDQAFIHIWIFESQPFKLYFCFVQQEKSTSKVGVLFGESDFVSDKDLGWMSLKESESSLNCTIVRHGAIAIRYFDLDTVRNLEDCSS